jgi:transcriptional regulator with XRE-family HTH domain
MDAKGAAEVTRVKDLLKTVVRVAGMSHREMERKLGQSPGYLSRLFAGAIELKLRHIVEILGLIDVEPAEFFQLAYPPRQTGLTSATARQARDLLALFPLEAQAGRPKQADVDEMVRGAVQRLLSELSSSTG